jgi:hypothetical protein
MIVCSAEPGACCDVITAECLDEVPVLDCLELGPAWQTHPALPCDGLAPPCGDPGCCCDFPEPGEQTEPHFAFHANCAGRFIPGAYPLCGDLDQSGTVDISDYNMFLDAFGTCVGQSGYNAAADLDGDGCVSLVDFQAWRNCYQFQGVGCTADTFDPQCGTQMVLFDTSVGSAAPPPTLCGQPLTPFAPDPRPLWDHVTTLPTPCTIPGVIGINHSVNHRRIGAGWTMWSHDYTGDVYYCNGWDTVTLTMPVGTTAVYFYVEPDNWSHTFQVLVNGTYLSEEFTASSAHGAAYVGICGNPVETVTLTSSTHQFAIGEFGITCVDMPGACCAEWDGTCTDDVLGSACAAIAHFRFAPYGVCDEFDPPCSEVQGACCYEEECVYQHPEACYGGGGSYGGDGVPCGPNPCLCADGLITAPGAWGGNTCFDSDDCDLRAGRDLIVKVLIPSAGNWQFDLCWSSPAWDTYMFLGTECCASNWYNDDGCSTDWSLSVIERPALPAGTYYVDIEPCPVDDCGDVFLAVWNHEPAGDAQRAKTAPMTLEEVAPDVRE